MGDIVDRILIVLARVTSKFAVWYRWPFPVSDAIIIGHRAILRQNNLYDTEVSPVPPPPAGDFDIQSFRTADGSYNDLAQPWMGRAGARFGRNMPLALTYGETAPALYEPNPRLVSSRLLARDKFVPVPHLNVLAAAWIQFMVHDWLSHGTNDRANPHFFPVPEGDDWPGGMMEVLRTKPDPQPAGAANRPAAYTNTETHWWDASQIYGSTLDRQILIRTEPDKRAFDEAGNFVADPGNIRSDGKIPLDENGLLPPDPTSKFERQELTGVNGNWWIGLSVLHTLFTREHNSIVDRLKIDFPKQSGEWLFQKARLVNAALIAKIHTVEWTPALMNSPSGRFGMRGNFFGLLGEEFLRAYGRIGDGDMLSGIPGSRKEDYTAPYAMTEEFVASYRLHSLIPDGFSFRSHEDDRSLFDCDLKDVFNNKSRDVYQRASLLDIAYSLGTSHPGALVLHNYPNALRRLDKRADDNVFIDLAAVDVLRDRERGVPRYCEFRRQINAPVPKSFEELTNDETWRRELKEVYSSVEQVDLLVGTLAESNAKNGSPPGFGFSDTVFRIFVLMASRRLKSDRFFAEDYRPEIYTPAGFDWIEQNSFGTVLQRHLPELAPDFAVVRNVFFPWTKAVR
ncbi:putative peroxidase [Labrys miyagiensis]|uniref:Peroxidase n=1 Tax=Labrys miyagiensis TaxID=346912 RepID=A0ABQ6CRW4_9HYPH|nr:peroxidase family protein [Labrys miyagiensis]GLS22523.1 putative peroxidase [Labrys miyagiensis]